MESLSCWFKYFVVWTVFVAVLTKETKEIIKDDLKMEEREEGVNFWNPYLTPAAMSYYGQFQYPHYPAFLSGYQMFENFDESDKDDVEPPNIRSIHKEKQQKTNVESISPFRREVLLWPRPCGWEWDGNTYKWGPCNIFFGGPGFPW